MSLGRLVVCISIFDPKSWATLRLTNGSSDRSGWRTQEFRYEHTARSWRAAHGARVAPHARMLLAADPVSGCHAPAASITHPSVRRPVVAWPTRAPVAAHPNMAAASPIPIARKPDVTRCRSHPDHLHARRGRSDRHHAAAVIARCWSDNAAAQQGGRQQCRGSQNLDSVERPHKFSKCLANDGLTHRDDNG